MNERERVTHALDALTRGLYPYVERELKAVYQDRWHETARGSFRDDRGRGKPDGEVVRWDAQSLLTVMWDQWNRVFRHRLGRLERSLVSELREFRNRWAHQENFGFDDTHRILDSAERLLKAVKAKEAKSVAREKRELLRNSVAREAKAAYRKTVARRRKWQDLGVYAACCASIIFVILEYFGTPAWFFAGFVVFVFGYLGWQRVASPPQLCFGPHECAACRRIIYGETCPYCEPVLTGRRRSDRDAAKDRTATKRAAEPRVNADVHDVPTSAA